MNALKLAAPSVAKAMTPQASPYAPEKPKPDMLSQAGNALVRGFQRGFDPQGFAASQEQSKMDEQERAKQTLALMQQQRQMPEPQRAVWWQQNADQIGQIVGADVRSIPVDPSKFSDQALDGQIAMLSAKLGMAPEQPEYMNLGGGNVGMTRGGEFSMVREAPGEPVKPTVVNNRVLDPNDPTKVLADYSDPAKPAEPDKFQDAQGNWFYVDPQTGEKRPVGIRGRVPDSGGGSGDTYRPATPQDLAAWGIPEGTPVKINNRTGEPQVISGAKPASEYSQADRTRYAKAATALSTLKSLTDEYRAVVQKYGPQLVDFEGKDRTPRAQELLAAHNNLMMFLKGPELFNLGVLTGPDVERLQRTLPEPVGVGTMGHNKETLQVGLDSLDSLVGFQMDMIPEEFRKSAPQAGPGSPAPFAGASSGAMGPAARGAVSRVQAPAAIAPGSVDVDDDTGERYRFKGGDPTDQRNWELVR